MRRHPVCFTDTAKHDIREFLADPAHRIAWVHAAVLKLGAFPRAHRACPAFGPDARFCAHDGFTVIYDVASDDGELAGEVAIRHVWPSRGQMVADLLGRLR